MPAQKSARIDGRGQANPATSSPSSSSPPVAAARLGRSADPTADPNTEHGVPLPLAMYTAPSVSSMVGDPQRLPPTQLPATRLKMCWIRPLAASSWTS